jgi:hypothetical protein
MILKTTVMDWTLASRQCCEWISGDDEAGCEETVTKQRVVLENLGAVGSGAQCHVSCFHAEEAERQLRGPREPHDLGRNAALWITAR